MESRIFHGSLTPQDIGRALVSEFNRANLRAQLLSSDNGVLVQISTRERPQSGGQTALSVALNMVEDGVAVRLGKQTWLGVAASIGQTAFAVWRNPLNLFYRLDDLAQDIEYMQLSEQVWSVIENIARSAGATFELSERLRRITCIYCLTANPVGEACCIACGAPLGEVQPRTCLNCGFVIKMGESVCPNCGKRV
jgi:hypothetical protein